MRILTPLRRGRLALVWGGLALSAIGDQLYGVALIWLAVGTLGPAAGYLSALQAAAVLVAALFGGRWAEGWDHRRAMIGADLVRAFALLVLAALAVRLPPLWVLLPLVAVIAGGQAFFQPALQAILPDLVEEPVLLNATNALLDATSRIARLVGPALVGLLAGLIATRHFFTLDAVSFLASALAVFGLGRLPERVPARRARAGGHLLAAIFRGFRAVQAHGLLGYILWLSGAIYGAWFAVFYLGLPLILQHHGAAGAGTYGLVMAAYGATNLLSNLVIGSLPPPQHPARLIFAGELLIGVSVILLGLAAGTSLQGGTLAVLLAAIAGLTALGGPMSDITLVTLRQVLLPGADLAAAVRAFMVANYAGMLVAMLISPTLFRLFGPAVVVCGCGVVIAVPSAWGLIRFAGWRMDGGLAAAAARPGA